MKTRYLIYTLALLAFCACSHEDDFMPTQGSAIPMGVSVNISDAVATRAETEMTDLQANSFMLDVQPASSGSEADEYTYADVCVKYVDGDGWGFYEADGTTKKQLMWVNANAETSFTATYPEVSGWSFNADQSTGLANDWLCFNKTLTYNETTGGQVPVMFQHTNTKLTVNLTIDETVHAGKTIKSVTVGGTKIAFTKYDVNTGYTLADDAGDITPYTNGNTYEAILLPQTADLKVTVMFEGDDNEYVWEQANTELIGGCHYTVNLKVTKKQLISIGTVTVSPWTEVEDPIDAGTATEPEANYSISDGTATITVPAYASAESVQAAAKASASATTITVNGTLTEAQQTALATGLTDYSGTLILDDMSSDDVTVDALKNMTVVYNGYVLDSPTNTYQVYTASGLYAWATATETDATTNLTLMADITLPNKDLTSGADITVTDGKPSGSNWTPVGTTTIYTGSIDGNDKTITGLRIYRESTYTGFVAQLNENGNIKNLHLKDVAVYNNGTNTNVGGVVGKVWQTAGDISGCSVSGSVMSYWTLVGGIVGSSSSKSGIITNCENHATVTGAQWVGGIVGKMRENSVTNCTNTGTVTATYLMAGGIVGAAESSYDNTPLISGCTNSGKVTSTDATYVNNGGIVGEIGSSGWTVIACANIGEVENGAGIVGANGGTVIACYTTQNSVVVTNQAGYEPNIYTGSIEATYYLGEDDTIEGTTGVSALNTDEVVDTMNNAISTWNASNNNACAYQWKTGTNYPELTANTAN